MYCPIMQYAQPTFIKNGTIIYFVHRACNTKIVCEKYKNQSKLKSIYSQNV